MDLLAQNAILCGADRICAPDTLRRLAGTYSRESVKEEGA